MEGPFREADSRPRSPFYRRASTRGRLKAGFKGLIGPAWLFRIHRLGRLRWCTKYRLMRRFRTEVGLATQLRYVLLDPEVESFSYEVENTDEMIVGLARALGRSAAELAGYAREVDHDPELTTRLGRHVWWRLDLKRRPPLGNRLAWYLLVRANKPRLVVETGIYLGLGSLTLLRALERNAEEGSPGELMSFDVVRGAGTFVPRRLRGSWQRFTGDTAETLPVAVQNRAVDVLFQDTPHTDHNQRLEFGVALAHAAPTLLLFDGSGGKSRTLRDLCEQRGGRYHDVPLRARNHIYPGDAVTFATFTKASNPETITCGEVDSVRERRT
jgi:hypothetical protein